jgi:FkbM family methyltransferase
MKFLFVAKQQKNTAAFLDTLQALVQRGHEVTVAVQERDEERDRRLEQQIDSVRFKVVPCPSARIDEWSAVAPVVRRLRDCVHILQPAFADSPALQLRILDRLRQELALESTADALFTALSVIPAAQMNRIESMLRLAERSIPTSDLFDEFLRSEEPDVVLISPLVHFGSAQADVAASARRLGIPAWMLLFSWDNLSTKGCMHVAPDLMFAWNERQRREAVELHRFPAARVVVTGAARFDDFFRLRPRMTREQFHEPLGLDPATPTLLYLCSSRLIAPRELAFIVRWLMALRSSGSDRLRTCNVVVRPHPDVPLLADEVRFERHRWADASEIHAQIAKPFDDPCAVVLRTSYKDSLGLYESLVHSTAVVGLNTTAELEAGIAGRPVFTILPDAAAEDGPRPTVHFHYLTRERGGFVSAASSLHEHVAQLATALAGDVDSAPIRSFIESFLRPHGIDRPVAPLLADVLVQRAEAAETAEAVAPSVPVASFDPRGLSLDESVIIPLAYNAARIVVRATPETLRFAVDGSIRLDQAAVKWLERWVKIGDVVYDIDAGFGAYVLIAARQRGASVVAFEPGYLAYAALCENVALNACQGSVIPVPLAVASRDSVATIKYGRETPGGQRHSVQKTRWRPKPADSVQPHVHSVCAVRLDTAVEQYGLPPATHLRVSAFASAIDVLAGAERTLAHPGFRSLWLHVAPQDEETLVSRLRASGLQVAVRRTRRRSVQIVFTREGAEAAAEGATAGRPGASARS